MVPKLSKSVRRSLTGATSPSHFNHIHGQSRCCSATAGLRSVDLRQTTLRGGRGPSQRQVSFLDGSSVPLHRLFHPPLDRRLHCPRSQVPSVLPYSAWLSLVQEKVLTLNPDALNRGSLSNCSGFHLPTKVNPRDLSLHSSSVAFLPGENSRALSLFPNLDVRAQVLGFSCRGLCTIGDCKIGSSGESDDEEIEGDLCDSVKSKADPKEVERVCRVIEELFAFDRNMEAVLDECRINLTHDLVVDVLGRFKHARRPAFRFFCWASKKPGFSHDSRTYNSMMTVLGKTRQFETMVTLLEEMGGKGLLTTETFLIAIKAFAGAKERKKAVGIFELMKKYNFKAGVDTINCLLDNLGRAKLGKEAQVLFEKLEGKFTPNLQTYTVLLNSWCRLSNLMEMGKTWNKMVDKGFTPDIAAHNTMLQGLLRSHKRSDAIKLLEVMKANGPPPNVRSYTILIRDLCKQKKMSEAVEIFEGMVGSGHKPDVALYTCLMTGFANQRKMDKVFGLLTEMKEKGCPPDGIMYNALIKMMTNRKMPDDALRIYKKMIQSGIQPTIHTFNMMMKSYFVMRNHDMGCAVWEEMKQKGCCPDDNSYIVFIGGLIRQGRSVEACTYLEEMIEKGMKVPQLDFKKFAADFSKAGKPAILEEMAQRMKYAGKFEVSDVLTTWAETARKSVKRMDPIKFKRQFA